MTREDLIASLREMMTTQYVFFYGKISEVSGGLAYVTGLSNRAAQGDRVEITSKQGTTFGEVISLGPEHIMVLPDEGTDGLAIEDEVLLHWRMDVAPCEAWIGRVIDPYGKPMDGRPLRRGMENRVLRAKPPNASERRGLGPRLETGLCAFNTFLPIAKGQRLGIFAGSGVGKSMLLGNLVRKVEADVVVVALIGERGRELRAFTEEVLQEHGMQRSIVIAATSDQPAVARRRCTWTAMAVAEYFRDQGKHVLFIADSITRFAEAHREIALAGGEEASMQGYPPSTAHSIMSLAERAGPGAGDQGDITAILSVLVAGSDMEGAVADILRGTLDGHVILDRTIAERGRFPAIDLLRSVSRSLPNAATPEENAILREARMLLGTYSKNELMIQTGLYMKGSDPLIDRAISAWPALDSFIGSQEQQNAQASYKTLQNILHASVT